MKTDLTDITLVVDRSGSMYLCQDDAQGGINQFIEDQKKVKGSANLTLVQFDDKYEVVYNGVPISDVGKYTLTPRGNTALLDAVGKAITSAGERLDKLPEEEKPGCVIMVIVTDGQENASREYKRDKIKEMIELQKNKFNWQFTFLGADANAFNDGLSMGIGASSILQYNASDKSHVAYCTASNATMRTRMASMNGQAVNMSYTDKERNEVV
jgi:Mg-chelatase subunit ChlD